MPLTPMTWMQPFLEKPEMFNDVAEKFVDNFCESAVEFTTDMMKDCPEDYANFKDVNRTFSTSIESFSEACLDDYLNDLCNTIRERLKQKKVVVNAVTTDEVGFKYASYNIVG